MTTVPLTAMSARQVIADDGGDPLSLFADIRGAAIAAAQG
jgi:hypothetical protein